MTSAPAIYDYMSQFKNGEGGIYNITNLNLYHYAGNNPIKYTDPDGRSPQPEVMTSAGAVAVSTEAFAVQGIENFVGKFSIIGGIFLILFLLTGDSQPAVQNEQIQEQAPSVTTDKAHEAAGEAKGDASANENNDSHPPHPGDDPTKAPEGTVWKGAPGSKPGDSNGNY